MYPTAYYSSQYKKLSSDFSNLHALGISSDYADGIDKASRTHSDTISRTMQKTNTFFRLKYRKFRTQYGKVFS